MEKQFLGMNSTMERMTSNDRIDNPNVNSSDEHQRKRKRYTFHQMQELEAYFKECPRPDGKQKRDLSRQLGMEEVQITFWFQNKRTMLKAKHERQENSVLRNENEKLRLENMQFKEALSSRYCPSCISSSSMGDMSSHECQLRMENARLREEVENIAAMVAKYVGKPVPYSNSAAAPSCSSPAPSQS